MRSRARGWIRIVLGSAAFTACAGESVPAPADEEGAAIVESLAPAWADGDAWVIDSVPLLDLTQTGSGPLHEFGAISGSLTGVSLLAGDSVLVYDSRLNRATVVAPDGSLGRVLTLPPTHRYTEIHPLAEGRIAALGYALDRLMEMPAEGAYRMPMVVSLLSSAGEPLDTLTQVQGFGGFREGGMDWPPLFQGMAHVDAGASAIVAAASDEPEFRRFDASGRLLHLARAPVLRRPLTEEQAQVERDAMIRPQSSLEHRSVVQRLPAPDTWPAVDELRIDPLGYVWMREFKSAETARRDRVQRWHVFAPEGALLGTLHMPERFQLHAIGADYLLGWYDARGGAYSVHLLGLRR